MKKYILLFISLIITLLPVANANEVTKHTATYSNLILFGDSLTDIGNFPESLMLEGDTSDSGYFTNAYVSIGNPVDPKKDKILPGLRLKFPSIDNDSRVYRTTLPMQLELCSSQASGNVCHKREFRSINWSEYFLYNGILRKLMASGADFRPWVIQYNESDVTKKQSVNYAMVSALSNDKCANYDLGPLPCKVDGLSLENSINQQQANYRNNQSETDASFNIGLREKVIVPALNKQIEMFELDRAGNKPKVVVDDDTLYIIYVEANDLSKSFIDFVDGNISFADFIAIMTVQIPAEIAGSPDRSGC